MCINRIWHEIANKVWYAIKPNQAKTNPVYSMNMYKQDLALNNLQGLKRYKTKPSQTKLNPVYLMNMYKQDLALNNL